MCEPKAGLSTTNCNSVHCSIAVNPTFDGTQAIGSYYQLLFSVSVRQTSPVK